MNYNNNNKETISYFDFLIKCSNLRGNGQLIFIQWPLIRNNSTADRFLPLISSLFPSKGPRVSAQILSPLTSAISATVRGQTTVGGVWYS